MSFEEYKTKPSVVVVYTTGEGKGQDQCRIGSNGTRARQPLERRVYTVYKILGRGRTCLPARYCLCLRRSAAVYKGGKGLYKAGGFIPQQVTEEQHRAAALETYEQALAAAQSGSYQLVVCDEINNAVHDGLLTRPSLKVNHQQGGRYIAVLNRPQFPGSFGAGRYCY